MRYYFWAFKSHNSLTGINVRITFQNTLLFTMCLTYDFHKY